MSKEKEKKQYKKTVRDRGGNKNEEVEKKINKKATHKCVITALN